MRLTFLGTGTSMGVPMIACRCSVCLSTDPHNRRLRTSALLEVAGLQLLIDAGPDLREQVLRAKLSRVDAVLLTHGHADHIAGIDDLRPLNFAMHRSIPLYGTAATLACVRDRFSYAFINGSEGSTRPSLELVEIQDYQPFTIGSAAFLPLAVRHGTWSITGFRIGKLGYVTDASALDPATRAHLRGLDLLVLNALRHTTHPTHFSLAEACAMIEELQPQRALLVHMGHELDHLTTNLELPAHVQLAYDGQVVDLPGEV